SSTDQQAPKTAISVYGSQGGLRCPSKGFLGIGTPILKTSGMTRRGMSSTLDRDSSPTPASGVNGGATSSDVASTWEGGCCGSGRTKRKTKAISAQPITASRAQAGTTGGGQDALRWGVGAVSERDSSSYRLSEEVHPSTLGLPEGVGRMGFCDSSNPP